MSKPAVISLCDRTGNMVRPWAESGCECWCVDTQHSIRKDRTERVVDGLIHFVWGDARSWRLPVAARGRVVQFFAFPPCPHLTCTAARDFQKKGGWMLADAVQLFDSCEVAASYCGAPYMIENPATSRLNTHRRPPDFKFHPWQYAGYLPDIETDNTTKNTGLWVGGGFVIPPPDARAGAAPQRLLESFTVRRPGRYQERNADGICPGCFRGQPNEIRLHPRGMKHGRFPPIWHASFLCKIR